MQKEAYTIGGVRRRFHVARRDVPKQDYRLEESLHLAQRPFGNQEKAREVPPISSSKSFGNIQRNRERGAT